MFVFVFCLRWMFSKLLLQTLCGYGELRSRFLLLPQRSAARGPWERCRVPSASLRKGGYSAAVILSSPSPHMAHWFMASHGCRWLISEISFLLVGKCRMHVHQWVRVNVKLLNSSKMWNCWMQMHVNQFMQMHVYKPMHANVAFS
jgi:hypothetical protein